MYRSPSDILVLSMSAVLAPAVPITTCYFRCARVRFRHHDGRHYAVGEILTARPVYPNDGDFSDGLGNTSPLTEENDASDYVRIVE